MLKYVSITSVNLAADHPFLSTRESHTWKNASEFVTPRWMKQLMMPVAMEALTLKIQFGSNVLNHRYPATALSFIATKSQMPAGRKSVR